MGWARANVTEKPGCPDRAPLSRLAHPKLPSIDPAPTPALIRLAKLFSRDSRPIVLTLVTFFSMMLARFGASGSFSTALYAVAYLSGSALVCEREYSHYGSGQSISIC